MKFVFYVGVIFVTAIIGHGNCYKLSVKSPSVREQIVGGIFTNITEAPYHVSLSFGSKDLKIFSRPYFCGGVLITLKHVLTAAHCTEAYSQFNILPLIITAGRHNLNEKGIKRVADSYHIHPKYNSYELIFDISVIIVAEPFEYSPLVQTIKLPTSAPKIGDKAAVTGFGIYDENADEENLKLRKMITEVIPCDADNPEDFCTQSFMDIGACQGDSGGPVINERMELIGLVSRGPKCAVGYPDINANVYYLKPYIFKIINARELQEYDANNKHFKQLHIFGSGSSAPETISQDDSTDYDDTIQDTFNQLLIKLSLLLRKLKSLL